MKLSYMALNRIVENPERFGKRSAQPAVRRPGPVLSDARALSDEELSLQLERLGVRLDRSAFSRAAEPYLSAEQMCRAIAQRIGRPEGIYGSDWLWCCLTASWERWLPERPGFEMLDDWMQEGYRLLEQELAAACRRWAELWRQIVRIVDERGFESIDAFDDAFRGTQCVYNWVQTFEMHLGNAALRDPGFLKVRIRLCEEYLERFAGEDRSTTVNMRSALAESHFEAGGTETAEALYEKWLTDDPRWGWGWIYWSDLYAPRPRWRQHQDAKRAEQLLRLGLGVPGVRDRPELVDRLKMLYEDTGRKLPVEEFGPGPQVPASEDRSPMVRRKVGRNEPCPCGSGRKYKKCCAKA
jgi:hypothetical protein